MTNYQFCIIVFKRNLLVRSENYQYYHPKLRHKLWFMTPAHTCGPTHSGGHSCGQSFPGPPGDITHPAHPSHGVICSRSCLSPKTIFSQADTHEFQVLLPSFKSCPLTSGKSDFASFMSHKATLIMTEKPQGVQMTYLDLSQRT